MLVNSFTGQFLDGVYTRILPPPIGPNTNIATGTCILLATTDWGPIAQAVACGNLNAFISAFGTYAQDVTKTYETSGFVQAWGYFTGGVKNRISGGGNDLRVIRIAGSTAAAAAKALMDNAATPAQVGTYNAKYKGGAGNNIQVTVTGGSPRLGLPSAPAITGSATGGTIPATPALLVALTAVTNIGETSIGAASNSIATTGATSSATVPLPAVPSAANFTGFNVYVSTNAGATWSLANPSAPVNGASYTLTALPPGTNATPPVTNGASTTFNVQVTPFDGSPAEVFNNLTPATAAAAINSATTGSKWGSWTVGTSVLCPVLGSYFLTGGDSGLNVADADYVGVGGLNPTGLQLALTIKGANYLIAGSQSTAVKSAMQSVADTLYAQAIVGPSGNTVTVDTAVAEIQGFNDWRVAYPYGYQNWLNPYTGVVQSVLPVGSIAGARCNGPYWVSVTQLKLTGYLGPTNPLSDLDAGRIEQAGGIPITDGSLCRSGCSTSQNVAQNQMEDFQVAVFIARAADATAQPLLGEPQVFDPKTNSSSFFDQLKAALEDIISLQPREAIVQGYVIASYDPTLASQNKARAQMVVQQTGKANQILIDVTSGRTAISTIPAGITPVVGS